MERHAGFAGWCRTCGGPCKQDQQRGWQPVTPAEPMWWVFWGIVWVGTFISISVVVAIVRYAA